MAMKAANLRERITIQRQAAAGEADGWGAGAGGPSWEDEAVVWADVRDLKAGEGLGAGGAVQATVTHRVEIRYRAGLNSRKRILHDGRTLDIISVVDPHQRREKLIIDCAQNVDQETDEGA
jgi:SPP1 family predicted phage head-tail adaptor